MPELVSIPHTTNSGSACRNSGSRADLLALAATYALIEEANLTPKPGLVDRPKRSATRAVPRSFFRLYAHEWFRSRTNIWG